MGSNIFLQKLQSILCEQFINKHSSTIHNNLPLLTKLTTHTFWIPKNLRQAELVKVTKTIVFVFPFSNHMYSISTSKSEITMPDHKEQNSSINMLHAETNIKSDFTKPK